jgi:hypothetical protein
VFCDSPQNLSILPHFLAPEFHIINFACQQIIKRLKMKRSLIYTFLIFTISLTNSSFGQQWGEYTLYAVQNQTTAYLIDTNNTTYHSWTFGSSYKTGYSTYLMPGGTLVRTIARQGNQLNGGGCTGEVQKVNWSGTVTWDYIHSSSTYCLHHDICPLENGNVLMISYEVKTAAQVTQAGCSQNISIWAEKIIEVQPTGATIGNIVWEWHVWNHLCQSYNSLKDNYVTSIVQHPELININYNTSQDWMHMNGIDYNPDLDQIVVSSHNLNELYVIDHSTTTAQAATHSGGNSGKGGDILYRWGNPAAYQASGTNIFHVPHDSHWIPGNCPNGGYLAAFNNNGISSSQSSVDLISPPYNGYSYFITLGQAFLPSTYTWRHACSGHTQDMGNSQQLPNGNMLICIAQTGYIYEINPSGTTIWSKTVSGMVPQAYRYSACYVNGTIPVTPTITQNGDSLISSAATTYTWYFEGTLIPGATSQILEPSQNGIYQVKVTNASGCESELSDEFNFIDPWKFFDLKVMLEGPYTDFGMTTLLNSSSLLPLSHPYGSTPWNYSGSETVTVIPNNTITDWVLVELRQTSGGAASATAATRIARRAGFLLSNGKVVDIDGNSVLRFYASITQNLFVVVWHRNHLAIMSANPLVATDGIYELDFTATAGNAYWGAASQKELASSVWGMVAGDANNDKLINVTDKNIGWSPFAGKKIYKAGDFNLDSEVDNPDKNYWWLINTSYQSHVPD